MNLYTDQNAYVNSFSNLDAGPSTETDIWIQLKLFLLVLKHNDVRLL